MECSCPMVVSCPMGWSCPVRCLVQAPEARAEAVVSRLPLSTWNQAPKYVEVPMRHGHRAPLR